MAIPFIIRSRPASGTCAWIRCGLVPPMSSGLLEKFGACVRYQLDCYHRLTALLKPDTHRILADIWHLHSHPHEQKRKKVEREAEKKAIETARYVIPVAAMTSMVHTVSGIVLHRLHRLCHSGDTPYETSLVITEMVQRVREVDPTSSSRWERKAAPPGTSRSPLSGPAHPDMRPSSTPGCRGAARA